MTDESLVTLIGETEEHAGGDFSSDPALRAEDTSADEAAEHASARSHVRGTFESAAVPDLGALVHDDSPVPDVEDDAGLYGSAKTDEVGWITQDEASLGNRVTRGRQKVGAVIRQEVVERGEQVESPAEPEPVDLERGSFLMGTAPSLALRNHPANSLISMNQSAYAMSW
jgi:hypothetical protein